jgi:hypothetical protein
VAKVRADGTGLEHAGYIGGEVSDGASGVALGPGGSVYVAGQTGSTEATFPVVVGPDSSYAGGGGDAFVAKLSSEPASCAVAAMAIRGLLAAKSLTAPGDVFVEWLPDAAAAGYNLWYVTDKADIPDARLGGAPAIPVAGCAVPTPAAGVTCTDVGAVTRDPSRPFFYQVRVYCDAMTEGP